MKIVLYVFDKDTNCVATHVNGYNNKYEFISGSAKGIEGPTDALIRIVKEAGLDLDRSKLKYVRRESHSCISGRDSIVNSITTFGYISSFNELELSATCFGWYVVDDVITALCKQGKYFEAAYIDEAYKAVQNPVSLN